MAFELNTLLCLVRRRRRTIVVVADAGDDVVESRVIRRRSSMATDDGIKEVVVILEGAMFVLDMSMLVCTNYFVRCTVPCVFLCCVTPHGLDSAQFMECPKPRQKLNRVTNCQKYVEKKKFLALIIFISGTTAYHPLESNNTPVTN